jgi:hypothetical protein
MQLIAHIACLIDDEFPIPPLQIRFWVILVFSVIYLAGLAGITGVNAQPSIKPRFMEPPANGSFEPTRSMFWGFMYLIALGG